MRTLSDPKASRNRARPDAPGGRPAGQPVAQQADALLDAARARACVRPFEPLSVTLPM